MVPKPLQWHVVSTYCEIQWLTHDVCYVNDIYCMLFSIVKSICLTLSESHALYHIVTKVLTWYNFDKLLSKKLLHYVINILSAWLFLSIHCILHKLNYIICRDVRNGFFKFGSVLRKTAGSVRFWKEPSVRFSL